MNRLYWIRKEVEGGRDKHEFQRKGVYINAAAYIFSPKENLCFCLFFRALLVRFSQVCDRFTFRLHSDKQAEVPTSMNQYILAGRAACCMHTGYQKEPLTDPGGR